MSETYVYIIRCEQYIKVGRSTDVKKRLKGIKSDNPFPLKILGFCREYDFLTESSLQDFFKRHNKHHRNEWYMYDELAERTAQVLNDFNKFLTFYTSFLELEFVKFLKLVRFDCFKEFISDTKLDGWSFNELLKKWLNKYRDYFVFNVDEELVLVNE